MIKEIGTGMLVLASALNLAGCNTASNSSPSSSGPTLNTGNSVKGLFLANTAGGTSVNGYIAFNNAASFGIASGGNPDALSGFSLDPGTGHITFTPVASQRPGIYPIYIDASDSAGNLTTELFQAYVYGTSGGTSANPIPLNATEPPVVSYSMSNLTGSTGNASGTVGLGIYNGITDATLQKVTVATVAGNSNANSITLGSPIAVPIPANPETATVSTSFTLKSVPTAGGGGTGCGNGVLLLLTAYPLHDNLQSPDPFQEYICLDFTS